MKRYTVSVTVTAVVASDEEMSDVQAKVSAALFLKPELENVEDFSVERVTAHRMAYNTEDLL